MTTGVKAAASPFRELFTLYDVRSADDTFMEAWNPANIAIAKQCTYLHPQRIATKADRTKLLRELHETEQGLHDLNHQTGKSHLRIRIKYALKSYYQDSQRTDCANQPSKQDIQQWSWQQLFCSFFVFLVEKGDQGLDAKRLQLLWRWASDLRQHWAQQNYGGDRFINDHTRPDTNARAAVILGVAIYNEWACKLMDTVPRLNPSQPLFFVEDVDQVEENSAQVPAMSDRIMSLETCAAADIVYIMKEHLHEYLDHVNVQNHKEKILEYIATNDMNGAKLKKMDVKTFVQIIIKHCGDKKLNGQVRKIHKELAKFDFTTNNSEAKPPVNAPDDEKKDVEPMTTERLQEVFERERAAAASSPSTLTQSTTTSAPTEEQNDADANSAAPPYSRFVTVANVTVANVTVANANDDNKQPEMSNYTPYSFGCLSAFEEINLKYDNFKNELLHNETAKLSLHDYEIHLRKAQKQWNTDQARQTIHKDDRARADTTMHMDDEKDAEKKVKTTAMRPRARQKKSETSRSSNAKVLSKTTDIRVITVDHLLAVVIYCACTKLQYEFSKTFRMIAGDKNEDDVKKRNREFGHWTRLLSEVVNDYGDTMESCAVDSLYHGITTRMVFPSFKVKFDCPTSLTVRKDVAARFASRSGIVLRLKMDSSDLMFFNCTWLSNFPEEDERLVLFTPTIKLHNITVMQTGTDYKFYVRALNFFNHCIQGCKPPGEVESATKKDGKIIQLLLNQSRDQMAAPVFAYVWRLFGEIAKNVKDIHIDMNYMDQFYGEFSSLLFAENGHGVFRFSDVCKVFKNCKKIWIQYRKNQMDFVAKRDEFLKEFEETVKYVEWLKVKFNAKPAANELKQLRSNPYVKKAWQGGQGNITLIVVRKKMTIEETICTFGSECKYGSRCRYKHIEKEKQEKQTDTN